MPLVLTALLTLFYCSAVMASDTLLDLDAISKQAKQTHHEQQQQQQALSQPVIERYQALLQRVQQQRDTLQKLKAQSKTLEKRFHNNKLKHRSTQSQLNRQLGELKPILELTHQFLKQQTAQQLTESASLSSLRASFNQHPYFVPTLEQLNQVWGHMLTALQATAQITVHTKPMIQPDGRLTMEKVTAIGPFALLRQGQHTVFNEQQTALIPLTQSAHITALNTQTHMLSIDPTGPSGFTLLKQTLNQPSMIARLNQAGPIGFLILGLGCIALILGLWRAYALYLLVRKTRQQMCSFHILENNPLSRILSAYRTLPKNNAIEDIECCLSEMILKEKPKIEVGLNELKMIATVSPLLGLLGTVTGMITGFQSAALQNTTAPDIMAAGISSALMTTALGLIVAIPTVFIYSLLRDQANRLLVLLEQYSMGLLARHTEKTPL